MVDIHTIIGGIGAICSRSGHEFLVIPQLGLTLSRLGHFVKEQTQLDRPSIPRGIRRSEANVKVNEFASRGGVCVQQKGGRNEGSHEERIQAMPAAEVAAESPHAGTTPGITSTAVAKVWLMILKPGRHLAMCKCRASLSTTMMVQWEIVSAISLQISSPFAHQPSYNCSQWSEARVG